MHNPRRPLRNSSPDTFAGRVVPPLASSRATVVLVASAACPTIAQGTVIAPDPRTAENRRAFTLTRGIRSAP